MMKLRIDAQISTKMSIKNHLHSARSPSLMLRGGGRGVGLATSSTFESPANQPPLNLLRSYAEYRTVFLPHPRPFPKALGKGDSMMKLRIDAQISKNEQKNHLHSARSPSLKLRGGAGGGVELPTNQPPLNLPDGQCLRDPKALGGDFAYFKVRLRINHYSHWATSPGSHESRTT